MQPSAPTKPSRKLATPTRIRRQRGWMASITRIYPSILLPWMNVHESSGNSVRLALAPLILADHSKSKSVDHNKCSFDLITHQVGSRGGDFHICTDGNFHHRHLVSGGQGVPFHTPMHVIPKAFVDEVGLRVDQARKRKPKPRNPKVPDEAIDECQESYEAADGDKKKAAGLRYDAQGWMSLVCRHDIPLFFANIDTPGEQQKFVIALIIWFFYHVPKKATVKLLYDIGCVLARSIELVRC